MIYRDRTATRRVLSSARLALFVVVCAGAALTACDHGHCHDTDCAKPLEDFGRDTLVDMPSDDESDDQSEVTGPDMEAIDTYCNCMLVSCHDDYHSRWGDSDDEARTGCIDEVSMRSADALACQTGACMDATCDVALGTATCSP